MYSINPYYFKNHIAGGAYSRPSDGTNLITEPRQNGILSKVDTQDLGHIFQSIPILPEDEDVTALEAYLRFVFVIVGDFLIKMDTPNLNIVKTARGFRNTKLIAGAFANTNEGPHIYTITDGELRKINIDSLEVVKSSSNWEDATFIDGAGPFLYVVVRNELIRVNAENLDEEFRTRGWINTKLFTVPGDGYIYAVKGDELIRYQSWDFERDPNVQPAPGWRRATVMASSGNRVYIVKDGELSSIIGSTLQSDPNVKPGSIWGDTTLMSAFYDLYVVTEKADNFKNPELTYRSYTDYSQHNSQLLIPRAHFYYHSSYYPYNPYYPYFCYFGIKFI